MLGNSERALQIYEKLMDDQDEIDVVFQRAGIIVALMAKNSSHRVKTFSFLNRSSDRCFSERLPSGLLVAQFQLLQNALRVFLT